MTRRFSHLIVTSACLAKCDEEEQVPPRHVCYVPHFQNTRQWELPPYAHHFPASLKTQVGGLVCPHPFSKSYFKQRRAQLWPSPSLTRNTTWRPLLPTPALQLMFRAMEDFFMPITPPCHILQPSMPSFTQNASQRAILHPLSCISSDRGLCSCPPCPPSLKTRVGGSVLPPPALHLAF